MNLCAPRRGAARRAAPLLVVLCLAMPGWARAQTAAANPRLELSFGGWLAGPVGFGVNAATETRPSGGVVTLFTAESSLRAAKAFGTRLGYRVNPQIQVEAAVSLGSADLRVEISDDWESDEEVSIAEPLKQIVLEGGILFDLDRRPAVRNRPFVTVGAGHFWELHDGRILAETGQHFFAGAGLRRMLTTNPKSRLRSLGARAEVRAVIRSGGVAPDRSLRLFPRLGGSVFYRF